MNTSSIQQQPCPAQPKRYITDEGRIQNAIERAHNLGHYARKVSDTHYRVYSENHDGSQYDVRVTCSGLVCNCKAAQFGKVCKHAARVALRLQREGACEAPQTPPAPVCVVDSESPNHSQPRVLLEDLYN